MAEIRVLVVSNCESDRRRFSEILPKHGCVVVGAPDYNTIFKLVDGIHDRDVDVILIDLAAMSDQQGIKILRKIKARRIRAGIIVLDPPDMKSFNEVWQLGISGVLSRNQQDGIMDPDKGADVLYAEVVKASRMHVPEDEVKHILEMDPFEVTWEQSLKLDSCGIDEIHRKAHEAKDEWADKKLRKEGFEWLMLCGDWVSGGSIQKLPKPEYLKAFGRGFNRVPFLFIWLH